MFDGMLDGLVVDGTFEREYLDGIDEIEGSTDGIPVGISMAVSAVVAVSVVSSSSEVVVVVKDITLS